jgi:alpha-ketoglutarate-dependent taurine dioxygenase
VSAHGATLLLFAKSVASKFRTYRGGQIIKHFKMSPWTTELSHTTRDGEFHTDLNTEPSPPAITAMQCLDADPGAPEYGVSRVARMADLLAFLEESGDAETLDFLTRSSVTMLNDRSQSSWSGRVVEAGAVRYHPETLRAAARRSRRPEPALEERIAGVARAAFAVSEPFILDRGDVLLLSNRRTLHYRGECSVVFKNYPTEFVSRSVFILHAAEEALAS